MSARDLQAAWQALAAVKDPEIPAISVVDLGIVRSVESDSPEHVRVEITPTYSGCPAMAVIERSVGEALREHFARVEVVTALSPPWTTDWITPAGREHLRSAGIAPPAPAPRRAPAFAGSTLAVIGAAPTPDPECPRCGTADVARVSEFGSTACKSLWRCRQCGDPFDEVKAL